MCRICDPTTIQANTARAAADPDRIVYGPVSMTITRSSSTAISFHALNKDRLPKEYTDIPWNKNKNMWIECPSTLSATADKPPAVKATGVLYLAQSLIQELGLLGTPKWPTALPMVEIAQLPLWPTSVVVSGYQLHDGQPSFGSVDLLNPRHALTVYDLEPGTGTPQQLVLDGCAITLSLTPAGFSECFGLEHPIEILKRAVETIREGADPHKIVSAWQAIATWMEMSATRAELRTAEARSVVRQVLKRSDL